MFTNLKERLGIVWECFEVLMYGFTGEVVGLAIVLVIFLIFKKG